MCLAHTSHPGASGFNDPVPSRYALPIGEIEVLVISDGVMLIPTETLATNTDAASRSAWLNDKFLPQDAFGWPMNVVVVRSGGRTILIDSGLGSEYPDFPKAGRLALRLEAAGIPPESLTDIVLTHLHMDHVGGLLGEGLHSRLSSDVRVHVAAVEAEFWDAPDFSQTSMPGAVPTVLRSCARRFLDQYRSHLQLFDASCEVAPGVTALRTGGHTPGHAVVRVASGGDRMTFVGDAVFPVGFDEPTWYNGFDHEPEEAHRVRVSLLREAVATRELVVGSHLSFPSIGHVQSAGDAFRSVPVYWDY